MPLSITIRQTLDHHADVIQYIAWREVTLESNGGLRMSKIDLGMPGDRFYIAFRQAALPGVGLYIPVAPYDIRRMVSYEDTAPILTVIERRDADAAEDRKNLRLDARRREEDIAYWRGLATHTWNWLALPFSPTASNPAKSKSQHHDSIPPEVQQPASVSTCVPNKANAFGLVHRQTAKVG